MSNFKTLEKNDLVNRNQNQTREGFFMNDINKIITTATAKRASKRHLLFQQHLKNGLNQDTFQER